MKLETKRLILRGLKKTDLGSLVENINNKKVSKWLLVVPYPYTKKDAINWMNDCAKKWKRKDQVGYPFGIELKEEKNIIGGINLMKVNKVQGKSEVGYWLGEKYWREGYGTEALNAILGFAFNKLKLRRIEAGVVAGNPSSGKLLEKVGFKKEGYKRKAVICSADNKIKDEIIYGLLKEEWRRIK